MSEFSKSQRMAENNDGMDPDWKPSWVKEKKVITVYDVIDLLESEEAKMFNTDTLAFRSMRVQRGRQEWISFIKEHFKI